MIEVGDKSVKLVTTDGVIVSVDEAKVDGLVARGFSKPKPASKNK